MAVVKKLFNRMKWSQTFGGRDSDGAACGHFTTPRRNPAIRADVRQQRHAKAGSLQGNPTGSDRTRLDQYLRLTLRRPFDVQSRGADGRNTTHFD
jgi:hypothetical protein